MTQQIIKNYFSKSCNLTSSDSESDDAANVNKYIKHNADISYYQNLFKKKEDLKKLAKVVVEETGVSECWKYFGSLYLQNRQILQKYKFCKQCLEEGILKG